MLGAVLLAGCASQSGRIELLVTTTPPGASCLVTRLGRPIATTEPTPAIARLTAGAGDIDVLCKRTGFADAAVRVPTSAPRLEYGLFAAPDEERRVDITLQPPPGAAAR
jgi:hypothetical protein